MLIPFYFRMGQESRFNQELGDHKQFTNVACASFTRIGAAILTYSDPLDNSLTVTIIVIVFDGEDTSNYPNCVNQKDGEELAGEFASVNKFTKSVRIIS
jgi:hypothetical protein